MRCAHRQGRDTLYTGFVLYSYMFRAHLAGRTKRAEVFFYRHLKVSDTSEQIACGRLMGDFDRVSCCGTDKQLSLIWRERYERRELDAA